MTIAGAALREDAALGKRWLSKSVNRAVKPY
jgi:hypothetical protein